MALPLRALIWFCDIENAWNVQKCILSLLMCDNDYSLIYVYTLESQHKMKFDRQWKLFAVSKICYKWYKISN